MNIIEMQNITKTLGTFHLELSELNVQQGYITGFIGENGSGKTTTIKLLMNMLFADSGHIRILGMDMPKQATAIKQAIGYMGDQIHIHGLSALSSASWINRIHPAVLPTF